MYTKYKTNTRKHTTTECTTTTCTKNETTMKRKRQRKNTCMKKEKTREKKRKHKTKQKNSQKKTRLSLARTFATPRFWRRRLPQFAPCVQFWYLLPDTHSNKNIWWATKKSVTRVFHLVRLREKGWKIFHTTVAPHPWNSLAAINDMFRAKFRSHFQLATCIHCIVKILLQKTVTASSCKPPTFVTWAVHWGTARQRVSLALLCSGWTSTPTLNTSSFREIYQAVRVRARVG